MLGWSDAVVAGCLPLILSAICHAKIYCRSKSRLPKGRGIEGGSGVVSSRGGVMEGGRYCLDTDECQSFVKTHWKSATSFCRSRGNTGARFESEMKTVTTSENKIFKGYWLKYTLYRFYENKNHTFKSILKFSDYNSGLNSLNTLIVLF